MHIPVLELVPLQEGLLFSQGSHQSKMALSEVECVHYLMQVGPALLNLMVLAQMLINVIMLSSVCNYMSQYIHSLLFFTHAHKHLCRPPFCQRPGNKEAKKPLDQC